MKTKKTYAYILFLLFFLVTGNVLKSQENFEGVVKFAYKYESKSSDFTSFILAKYFGDTSVVFIKNGKYKQLYPNARGITHVIYDSKSNQYFMIYRNIDTLFFADAGSTSTIYQIAKNPSIKKTILEYSCNSVTIVSEKDTTTYFYSSALPLSSEPFANHKMGGYNILTQLTKSVYLEMIYRNEYYISYSKAFSVEKKALNDSIFKLPNLPMKKR